MQRDVARWSSVVGLSWLVIGVLAGQPVAGAEQGQEPERKTTSAPARVEDAARVLNLETLPLFESGERISPPRVASLMYSVPGKSRAVFAFVRKQLAESNWKELPGGYEDMTTAFGTFSREGFRVSVSVTPMTDPKQPEAVMVSVMNHGNVELAQLPVPEGSKSIYAGPASALLVTDSPVAATKEAVRKLLEGQGWEPYGEAGETSYYKRNAVRLLATIGSAPAQGGKTTISYATEQLSADLPAPRETSGAQYADANKQLFFDSKLTKSEVAEFYREALGRSGWKPTTAKPVDSPTGSSLVFRNLARDLITLEIQPVNGLQRVLIRHQSAAEVADQERLAKIAAERMSREKEQEARKLTIELPKDAREVEATEDEVEFTVAAGKARAAVEVLRGTLKQAGWTEADSRLEAMFGNILLTKDKARVTLTYIETGIMPAEVTITAFGVKLERSVGH